ncbi:tetratricopeptide repeat protein [Petrocella sp. FN5]|uniref:tetratricopeptide repeat protein n=1 Tax=Petrocella sp. FN5 TaxID=3032002 RepID=UPI0023DB494E|nr:tetratricopeptide repeat protein [Petrocella sp. FN5]MDF1616665.1 tetratricopeptide repeat protein [Petrocella sp. FN5]
MYHHVEAFTDIIEDRKFINWLKKDLGLTRLANEIKYLYENNHNIEEIMVGILKLCSYTKMFDDYDFLMRLRDHLERPKHLQYKQKADRFFKMGYYKDALKWYKSAQKIHFNPLVENNMAVVYMIFEEFEMAKKSLEKSLQSNGHITTYLNKVKYHTMLGQYPEGLEVLDEIVNTFEDPLIWYYYGQIYEQLKQYMEALSAYERAYELSHSSDILKDMVRIDLELGNFDRVNWRIKEQCSETLLKLYIKAQREKRLENWSEYIMLMDEVVRLSEYNKNYVLELAHYYKDCQQIIKAIGLINMINKKERYHEEVLYTQASIIKQTGNYEGFDNQIDEIINQWKKEVRSNTID